MDVKETGRERALCLAAAHALVLLDDGIVVGDLLEKTVLEALEWQLAKGMLHHSEMMPISNTIRLMLDACCT